MSGRRLVLRPEFPFVELDRVLSALGWLGGATVAYPPLVPGEPELARWTKGHAEVGYSCNPAVWFRVIDARGLTQVEWEGLSDALPHLGEDEALALLGAEDDARVVLGVYAVHALGVSRAGERLASLVKHGRPLVRDLAAAARADLA